MACEKREKDQFKYLHLYPAGDDQIHHKESGIWLTQQLSNAEMLNVTNQEFTIVETWWVRMFPEIDDFLMQHQLDLPLS